MTEADEHIDAVILVVKNLLFSVDANRFEKFKLMNIVSNENGFTFTWESKSTSSPCSRCGSVSHTERHTYKNRVIIDEPILGLPVMHSLRTKTYICHPCKESGMPESFVEDISTISRKPYIKTTTNLDEKIVNDGIYRSANGLAGDYNGSIKISQGTILNRVKEAGGMATEKNLTETESVRALSVDDNNARKGAPSTATTVVVDIERHIILVVAKGADSDAAKRVFERFPNAEKLSRDRASAYSKAGDECGLAQAADIFHLVCNAHDAVKEALSQGMSHNIYTKSGDGWIEMPAAGPLPDLPDLDSPVPIFTLAEEDIAVRVQLASLTDRQERKYRRVIELLRLLDQGFGSKEICSRLGISNAERIKLLVEAADVVNGVEEKIDDRIENAGKGKTQRKATGKRAKPSSESIVAPYGDVVMKMVGEGGNHRSIHPVIQGIGYEGSANAIYQYIFKKRNEEAPGTDGGTAAAVSADAGAAPPRPPRVSMQRVTKTAVYKFVLHEAAVKRGTKTNDASDAADADGDRPEPVAGAGGTGGKSSAFCSDSVAKIIFGTEKAPEVKKKSMKLDFGEVADKHPVVGQSIDFLFDLHNFIDNADVKGLDRFIDIYSSCGVEAFEKYAKGLKGDYASVEFAILNRDINNGMIEGFNDKIKLLRKIRYGRAKEELVNAVSVLSTQARFRYSNYVCRDSEPTSDKQAA